jgi:hypothetical protein
LKKNWKNSSGMDAAVFSAIRQDAGLRPKGGAMEGDF